MNLLIRPIIPWTVKVPVSTAYDWLPILLMLCFAGFTAFCVSLWVSKKYDGNRKKTALLFTGIILSVTAILICFFGCAVSAVRGIILSLILLVSSYSDIKRREVDDYLSVMIVLTAFIGIELTEIPFMLLSAVLITIPTMLICLVTKGHTIGGADIKLIAACAFLLGIWKGYFGLTFGLILGILLTLIINAKKDKTEAFPLVPYLAVGFMTAYFI